MCCGIPPSSRRSRKLMNVRKEMYGGADGVPVSVVIRYSTNRVPERDPNVPSACASAQERRTKFGISFWHTVGSGWRCQMLERGARITVRAYRGALLERRVWQDAGRGVLVCSEEGFKRA